MSERLFLPPKPDRNVSHVLSDTSREYMWRAPDANGDGTEFIVTGTFWGGGGGGGHGGYFGVNLRGGGGGGGGSYAQGYFNAVPNREYFFFVGSGGVGSPHPDHLYDMVPGAGATGSTTYLWSLANSYILRCQGGKGGTITATGGAGGTNLIASQPVIFNMSKNLIGGYGGNSNSNGEIADGSGTGVGGLKGNSPAGDPYPAGGGGGGSSYTGNGGKGGNKLALDGGALTVTSGGGGGGAGYNNGSPGAATPHTDLLYSHGGGGAGGNGRIEISYTVKAGKPDFIPS